MVSGSYVCERLVPIRDWRLILERYDEKSFGKEESCGDVSGGC